MKTLLLTTLLVGVSLGLPQNRRHQARSLASRSFANGPFRVRLADQDDDFEGLSPFSDSRQIQPTARGTFSFNTNLGASRNLGSRHFNSFRESAEDPSSIEERGRSHFSVSAETRSSELEGRDNDPFSSELFDDDEDVQRFSTRMSLGRRFHPLGIPKRRDPVQAPVQSLSSGFGPHTFSNPHIHSPDIARMFLDDSIEVDDDLFDSDERRPIVRLSPGIKAIKHETKGERLSVASDILNQYNFVDVQGTTNWGYRTDDQYQEHKVHDDGTMEGEFGWTAPEGSEISIKYIADKGGYKVVSSHGTYQRDSADVLKAKEEHFQEHERAIARLSNQRKNKGIPSAPATSGVPLPSSSASGQSSAGSVDGSGASLPQAPRESTFGVPLPSFDQQPVKGSRDASPSIGVPLPHANLPQTENKQTSGNTFASSGTGRPLPTNRGTVPEFINSKISPGLRPGGASIGVPIPSVTDNEQERQNPTQSSVNGGDSSLGVQLPSAPIGGSGARQQGFGVGLPTLRESTSTSGGISSGVPLPSLQQEPTRASSASDAGVSNPGSFGVPLPSGNPTSFQSSQGVPLKPLSGAGTQGFNEGIGATGVPLPSGGTALNELSTSSSQGVPLPTLGNKEPSLGEQHSPTGSSFGVSLPSGNKVESPASPSLGVALPGTSQSANTRSNANSGSQSSFGVPLPSRGSAASKADTFSQGLPIPPVMITGTSLPIGPVSSQGVPLPGLPALEENLSRGSANSFDSSFPSLTGVPLPSGNSESNKPISSSGIASGGLPLPPNEVMRAPVSNLPGSIGVSLPSPSQVSSSDSNKLPTPTLSSNFGVPLPAIRGSQQTKQSSTSTGTGGISSQSAVGVGLPSLSNSNNQGGSPNTVASSSPSLGVSLPSLKATSGNNVQSEAPTRGSTNVGVGLPATSSAGNEITDNSPSGVPLASIPSEKTGRAESEIGPSIQSVIEASAPAPANIEPESVGLPLPRENQPSNKPEAESISPSQVVADSQQGVALPSAGGSFDQFKPQPISPPSPVAELSPANIPMIGVSLPGPQDIASPSQFDILQEDKIPVDSNRDVTTSIGVSLPSPNANSMPDVSTLPIAPETSSFGVSLPAPQAADASGSHSPSVIPDATSFGVGLPSFPASDVPESPLKTVTTSIGVSLPGAQATGLSESQAPSVIPGTTSFGVALPAPQASDRPQSSVTPDTTSFGVSLPAPQPSNEPGSAVSSVTPDAAPIGVSLPGRQTDNNPIVPQLPIGPDSTSFGVQLPGTQATDASGSATPLVSTDAASFGVGLPAPEASNVPQSSITPDTASFGVPLPSPQASDVSGTPIVQDVTSFGVSLPAPQSSGSFGSSISQRTAESSFGVSLPAPQPTNVPSSPIPPESQGTRNFGVGLPSISSSTTDSASPSQDLSGLPVISDIIRAPQGPVGVGLPSIPPRERGSSPSAPSVPISNINPHLSSGFGVSLPSIPPTQEQPSVRPSTELNPTSSQGSGFGVGLPGLSTSIDGSSLPSAPSNANIQRASSVGVGLPSIPVQEKEELQRIQRSFDTLLALSRTASQRAEASSGVGLPGRGLRS